MAERREVLRAMVALQRRAEQVARRTLEAYERARVELLGRLADGDETPLSLQRLGRMVALVEQRLSVLRPELGRVLGAGIAHTVRQEAEVAVGEVRLGLGKRFVDALPPAQAAAFVPAVPHGMVEALQGQAFDRIKATTAELQGRIRAELTQSMLMGEGADKAARRVLGTGVTLDGVNPAVPYTSVYARAEAIALTEMSTAANASHAATYQRLGLPMRWSAALCSTTCGACRQLNGQIRADGEEFSAGRFRGRRPPAHPRCRCRLVAVVLSPKERAALAAGQPAQPAATVPLVPASPPRPTAPAPQPMAQIGVHFGGFNPAAPKGLSQLLRREMADQGLLGFLAKHPLGPIQLHSRSNAQALAQYRRARFGHLAEISLALKRPASTFGQPKGPVGGYSVSTWANDKEEAYRRSLTHEMGHHLHLTADRAIDAEILSVWAQGGVPISAYAQVSHFEYFAESYGAWVFEKVLLQQLDPLGYDLVERVLRHHGVRGP